jgi:hypothetical protein
LNKKELDPFTSDASKITGSAMMRCEACGTQGHPSHRGCGFRGAAVRARYTRARISVGARLPPPARQNRAALPRCAAPIRPTHEVSPQGERHNFCERLAHSGARANATFVGWAWRSKNAFIPRSPRESAPAASLRSRCDQGRALRDAIESGRSEQMERG